MTKKRFNKTLPVGMTDAQKEAISAIAEREAKSEAQVVRDMIDESLEKRSRA